MNKGFTLVELLAVIVILALLATIAVPSAIAISSSIKKELYCNKVDMLLTDAKRWGDEHISRLSESCFLPITVDYLVEEGITAKENDTEGSYIINPYTNEGMDNNVIGLYIRNNRAQAFYVEENVELENACDNPEVTGRPTTACP